MPATPSRHKVCGISVRMLRAGVGPRVLFLHGANGLPPWLPFFEQISAKCELLVPEHPGYGMSDDPPWIRNIGDLAMYYLDFLEELGDEKVHVIGQSLGGWAAAEMAVRNCTHVASLSLLGPAGIRVKGVPSGDNFIWAPDEGLRNLYYDQSIPERMLAMPMSDEDADIALTNRFATTKFGWEPRWYNPSLERWLHRIKVPTLVMWGANDKLFPLAYAKRWGELMPDAKIEVVPECGHVPAVEKPDVTAKTVLALIGRS